LIIIKINFMSGTMHRRKLLKAGLFMAGGIPVIPGFFNKLSASPHSVPLNICHTDDWVTDESAILNAPPEPFL
jgi:hypothetical protein